MTKELIIFGVPIILNLIIFLTLHFKKKLDSRVKYKISLRGYKKIPNRKPKRKQWWAMITLIADGVFILVASYILYKSKTEVNVSAVPYSLPVEGAAVPILNSVREAAPKVISSIFENLSTIMGSVSTFIGILLGIRELKEKKKESKEKEG